MKQQLESRISRIRSILSITLRLAVAATVVATTVICLYMGPTFLAEQPAFALKQVEYSQAKYFNKEAFTTLMTKSFGTQLFSLDLDRVRDLLLTEAWIKDAVVRRKLPDTLLIRIEERVPVAAASIDDELFIVDREGVILDRFSATYQELDLPIAKGLQNTARENAQTANLERITVYLELIKDFREGGEDLTGSISEVDVSDPSRVAVIPADAPVLVYLGHEHFRQRYERFLSQKELYFQFREQYGLIKYVDATYESQVIFQTGTTGVTG